MAIRWKEEMIQFETFREAEVWADSITNEIHGRSITGYCTPDFKVATILAFYLAENSDYRVRSATVHLDEEIYYQVWVELKRIN